MMCAMDALRARVVAAAAFLVSTAVAAVAHATPPLSVPWPCGTTYSITQGHNVGSHDAEGAWAWDIGIGVGGEVVAPADGVVRAIRMDSSAYGCDSAFANSANYVVLDFGDGTEALFLHLQADSSSLSVGDPVLRGEVVARVGLSGWVCGAHLHFQIQETCGSWWCQSIPSEFEGIGDPELGTSIESDNCGLPCDATLAGGETVVDERTSCFSRQTSYWWSVPEGWEDHHFYTFGTDAAADDTLGRWTFDVDVAGTYRVEVHVPSTEADSTGARYRVDGGSGPLDLGVVDQSTQKGWVALGDVGFEVGVGRYLELGDVTGEAYELRRKLAYDAIRMTLVTGEGGGSTTGSGGSGPATTAGSGGGSGPGGEGAASGSGSPSGSGGAGEGGATPDDDGSTSTDEDDGCGIARAPAPSRGSVPAALLLATLAALGAVVRRRRG